MKTESITAEVTITIRTEVRLDADGDLVATAQAPTHGNAVVTEVGRLRHDREGWHVFDTSSRLIVSESTKRAAIVRFANLATSRLARWSASV